MNGEDERPDDQDVQAGKAAARTAIGKLIGDDAEVQAATVDKKAADAAAANRTAAEAAGDKKEKN